MAQVEVNPKYVKVVSRLGREESFCKISEQFNEFEALLIETKKHVMLTEKMVEVWRGWLKIIC